MSLFFTCCCSSFIACSLSLHSGFPMQNFNWQNWVTWQEHRNYSYCINIRTCTSTFFQYNYKHKYYEYIFQNVNIGTPVISTSIHFKYIFHIISCGLYFHLHFISDLHCHIIILYIILLHCTVTYIHFIFYTVKLMAHFLNILKMYLYSAILNVQT